MNDQQYFLITSLSYQLMAAWQELSSFRSGEAYVKLRADYERIIRSQKPCSKHFLTRLSCMDGTTARVNGHNNHVCPGRRDCG